ncbi:MAG: histidine phosphatase family protein [Acetatifactor sp.]
MKIESREGQKMTEFLMVRHGEPDYSKVNDWAKIAVAKNYAPLTETGGIQIQNAIETLKKEKAELIISSPFTRCMQGAAMMSKTLQLDVCVEHDLREWELDRTHSVFPGFRERLLTWQFNHRNWNRFSKWENPEDVRKRVLSVFERYLSYEKVIVSCHAMMIMYTTHDKEPLLYGQIRKVRYDGKRLEVVE